MKQSGTLLEEKQAWMRERQHVANPAALPAVSPMAFAEPHFTIAQIAEMWQLSPDSVRRLFMNEPGVLVLGAEVTRRGTRRYTTLRIPKSVAERVHRRLCTVGG